MLRLSGATSFALVFALALCANPLFAQGQGVLKPDVELIANSGPFEFDGSGPGLDLGKSSAVNLSGGDFTVHAWVKFASLRNDTGVCFDPGCDMSIVDKMVGINVDGWRLFKQSDNHFWFCLGGGEAGNGCVDAPTAVKSLTIPELGVWYGVTAVKKSGEIAIYVNGILEGTNTPGEFLDSDTAALLIGANFDEGAYLNGQVAEFKLFRSALSESNVRALYNASKKSYEAQKQEYEFIEIAPPGSIESHANGINAQGDIVGRFIDKNGQSHAFLWSNGSYRLIDTDRYTFYAAYGINARGDILADDANVDAAYLLRKGEVIKISFPGALWTSALKINDAGDIVGAYGEVPYTECGPYHGFLLSNGEYTQIELPVDDVSGIVVHGINDAGELVGVYTLEGCDESNPAYHGFLRGDGSFTKIDAPNSTATVAFGINERGAIVGIYDRAGERSHGFLFWKGVFTDIDFPGARGTRAKDINDRGWIVGDYWPQGALPRGFLAIRK